MVTPRTLEEAIFAAQALMTDEDRKVLEMCTQAEAGWRLHMTLGHMLRNALGLWTDDAESLYRDLMDKLPDAFVVVDGDTASSVLIAKLWRRCRWTVKPMHHSLDGSPNVN